MNSTTTILREDDLTIHIADTRLYWVFRRCQHLQLTWNELTATEREQQIESQRRAEYCALFDPCGGVEW